MSEKRRTLEYHIREEIQRTGYPLEIQVSDILDRNWVVFNNEPYLDEDENKTRRIDIYAIHETEMRQFVGKREPEFFVGARLLVECKKSDTHAWVFFTRREYARPEPGDGQIFDFLEVLSKGKKKFLDELTDLFPWGKLHYDRFKRIGHTYAEVKFQGKGKESSERQEIFEASNQLMKYASYEIQKESERIAGDTSNRNVLFLFPAIAFDGMLYEAIVKGGKTRLFKRAHILLETSRYSKQSGGISSYLIDVVAKDELPQYLRSLNKDIDVIRHFFSSKEEKLAEKADVYI